MLFEVFRGSDDKETTYRCEHCKRTFHAADIVLVDLPKMFITPLDGFCFVNKYDRVVNRMSPPSAAEGDKFFGCPHCLHAHPGAMLII